MRVVHSYRFYYSVQQDNTSHRLLKTKEEMDLGILATDRLSVSSECAEVAKKAMKVLGTIQRQFKDLNKECFVIFYKSFVRPHLEFAIQAWSPYFKRDIECLEKVQRRATKVVKGFKSLSYEDRLHKLGLTTLYDRR